MRPLPNRCYRPRCWACCEVPLLALAATSLLGLAAAPSVVDELPGMTRKAFSRWHEGSLGVPAGDKEWAKADKDEDGFVTEKERDDYEACCKFKPSTEAIKVSLGSEGDEEDEDDEDEEHEKEVDAEQTGLCSTLEAVDALVARFEAKEVAADEVKEVLRQSLYALGTRRVQSGGNSYATMTTPVKTATLHELTQGAREAIKQAHYEQRSREAAEAAGKAPPPPCEDTHEDCGFFAEEGECENNQEWMVKNCPKACGVCVDEAPFFEDGFVKHIKGKKGLKKFLKQDSKMVVMFWTPGCKYCSAAKPQFAQGAHRGATELEDVIWAAVDCSRNEALCIKQGCEKFPTFKFYTGADDWKAGGEPTVYNMETHPEDPSVFGTTKYLSDRYDEQLMAEWDEAPSDEL